MKRAWMYAVVGKSDGRVIGCWDWSDKPAIFFSRADAQGERERRYTFKDQMDRETRIKRVLVG